MHCIVFQMVRSSPYGSFAKHPETSPRVRRNETTPAKTFPSGYAIVRRAQHQINSWHPFRASSTCSYWSVLGYLLEERTSTERGSTTSFRFVLHGVCKEKPGDVALYINDIAIYSLRTDCMQYNCHTSSRESYHTRLHLLSTVPAPF